MMGSYYGTIFNLILMFSFVVDVLWYYTRGWPTLPAKIWSSISYELSITLQRKNQDTVMLCHLLKCLSNGCRWWEFLLTEMSLFCSKYSIKNIDKIFVVGGRPQRKTPQITNLHQYNVKLFYTAIDMQLQELNNSFQRWISSCYFVRLAWIQDSN